MSSAAPRLPTSMKPAENPSDRMRAHLESLRIERSARPSARKPKRGRRPVLLAALVLVAIAAVVAWRLSARAPEVNVAYATACLERGESAANAKEWMLALEWFDKARSSYRTALGLKPGDAGVATLQARTLKWIGDLNYILKNPAQAKPAWEEALAILRKGEVLLLFPEGTRIRTRELGTAKEGVALLALQSGVPVVPVYVGHTWEPRRRLFRRIPVVIRYGPALRFDPLSEGDRRERYRDVADRVMRAISELSEGEAPLAERSSAAATPPA